jgi:hypothetical protein
MGRTFRRDDDDDVFHARYIAPVRRRSWRVLTRLTPGSSWRDTGHIEDDYQAALESWPSIVAKMGHHDFKLEPVKG